jgi:hypothetical protein
MACLCPDVDVARASQAANVSGCPNTPAAAPRRSREVLRIIIRGYPLHPTEQDMISGAGIKDQELTRIVSMMLIELALLRLSRFKRLALLDTQRLELLVALHPRVWWARRAGGLRDRPGDDARALGYLQHMSRPLRDAGLESRALAYLQPVSRTCR